MHIHYFQRYHQKENVATANTMLLLSRLYQYDSSKFFDFLNSLVFQSQDFDPEITIELQKPNGVSTPDAVIAQKSFKVVVEVKATDWFGKNQLVNHLESFDAEDFKVLLTLSSEPMSERKLKDVNASIRQYNDGKKRPIIHTNTTFSELADGMMDVLGDRDQEMLDVIADFVDFCHHDGLIREDEAWKYMKAFATWRTFDFNIANGIYYHRMDRHDSPHKYLGLYVNKSVRAVGEVMHIVTAEGSPDDLTYVVEFGEFKGQEPPQWMKDKIAAAIEYGRDNGSVLDAERYFLVDKFQETDFWKATKYPPRGPRIFNLQEIAGIEEKESSKELAERLRGKSWS